MNIENVIIKPLLTEKSSLETELRNRYVFQVNKDANKDHIRKAIETIFNVKVDSVRTSNTAGKTKRVGRHTVKTKGKKKAYVQVVEGQKIELFKGI